MGGGPGRRSGALACALAVMAAALALVAGPGAEPAAALTLPNGFQDSIAFSGLSFPSAVEFAPDGRVFVLERRGVIKIFDGLGDTTPTTFADLRTQVHNYGDRGMVGLALRTDGQGELWVYVSYTYDAAIGGTAPRWGTAGADWDGCPQSTEGCAVSGRISRFRVGANNLPATAEQVLVNDWCQQAHLHTVGDLEFGTDGMLYASGGDGAFNGFSDYGQTGNPINPCGDPPVPVGGLQTSPTAEGGSLRAQDVRTTGDPTGLDGSIIRIDPTTGAAAAGNPGSGSSDPNTRRIVAYGFRNPYRMAFRPGTRELYVGDVGSSLREEVNRIPDAADATVENFGWPCYEGTIRQPRFDSPNLNLCESLYAQPSADVEPLFEYARTWDVVQPSSSCPQGGQAITGLAFYENGSYPAQYRGALFLTDYARECIWVMMPGADGRPDPNNRQPFVTAADSPVDITTGPNGDLFWVSIQSGTVHRISYFAANSPPVASATATPSFGAVPLNVTLDASGSTDPDPGDTLTFAWDADNDGAFDDGNGVSVTHTYTSPGEVTARVRVRDPDLAQSIGTVVVTPGSSPPRATVTEPMDTTTWQTGQPVPFSATATDDEDGNLPASAFSWELMLHHCTAIDCHTHEEGVFDDVTQGSFVGPDHEYPAHLELKLTVTDSSGLQDTVIRTLQPDTVDLTLQTSPPNLELTLGDETVTAPFSRPVIVGSTNTISAPTPQMVGATSYRFSEWSDHEPATHEIVAGSGSTYTATFVADTVPPVISNVTPQPTATAATITWTTDELATSRVRYGTSTGLGSSVTSPGSTTSHSVGISGLTCNTTYHYVVESTDAGNNTATTNDATFRTSACPAPGPVSDDFHSLSLNTNLWTGVNPLGDGSITLNGTNALLSVPEGPVHDSSSSGNKLLRIVQPVANGNFGIEAKFESAVTRNTQRQGLLVEQDASNYIRFGFLYDLSGPRIEATTFTNNSPTARVNKSISTGAAPLWMRVTRSGSTWVLSWSSDGSSFTQATTFTFAMTANRAGPFAGNKSSPAPAFTASVDYFFNTASPIAPEDGGGPVDLTPPTISNIVATPGSSSASFTWTTDEPATSRVDAAIDSAYDLSVENPALVTTHSLTLTGLTCATLYHYAVTSADAATNSTSSDDATFTTLPCASGAPVSDDFSGGPLNTSRWSLVNPLGDGSVSFTPTNLVLAVPSGATHDAAGANSTLRVMQTVADTSFEVEAKFDSRPTAGTQREGIIVEQGAGTYLRFSFVHDGKKLRVEAASIAGGVVTSRANAAISSGSGPLWMRVARSGSTWTMRWSSNGTSWSTVATFTQAVVVGSVGPFVGNKGTPAPAFSASIDHFFNTASPVPAPD